MKSMNKFSALLAVLVLSACGGGSPDADTSSYSVQPTEFNWTAFSCPGGVVGAVSVHTINGGRQPFRIRGTPGVEIGLASATDEFVQATKNADGDLVLFGRDPKFAIRTTLPCGSDVGVIALDDTSALVSVNITVAEEQVTVPTP